METGTDFEAREADYHEYVHGDNAEAAKPVQTEIVGDVTVREFPARSWSGSQIPLDTTVQQVASTMPQRTRLIIQNTGANPAFLSSERGSCTVSSALPLGAGMSIEFRHTGSVYATSDAALPTSLSLMGEYRDGGS